MATSVTHSSIGGKQHGWSMISLRSLVEGKGEGEKV